MPYINLRVAGESGAVVMSFATVKLMTTAPKPRTKTANRR